MPDRELRIAVVGGGGHGKVVIDAIEQQGDARVVLVLDDNPAACGTTILGYRIAGGRELLTTHRAEIDGVIVAIGRNPTRKAVADWIVAQGLPLQSVIHPAARVAPSAHIGPGTLVMPGAIVNADARIGANVIINSGAIVEHDCVLEDGVHVAPGSVLCGAVTVGAATLIGAGAVLVPGVRVASGLLVKAGSVVKRDMENPQ